MAPKLKKQPSSASRTASDVAPSGEEGVASETLSNISGAASSNNEKKKVKKSTPSTNKGDKLEFLQDSGFKGKPIAMTGRRYGVAITWDPVDFAKPVDLDLQAIIIDKRGYIVDAVYYNNLIALNGAVSHSGDEVTGQASDFDEMVWAVFVKMMLFVVAACGDSALRDAANATVHVVQEFHGHTVLRFPCEKSRADVDVIVMMEKDNEGKWWLYQVDEPAEHGEHFLDILEPTVGDIIRRRIDNAPKHQRVTFQMKKGTAVDLPKNALKRLNFSVMATIKAKVRKEIDLDISALFTDKDGNALGACWHEELELFGFQHSGDRDADEDMNVDLLQVPSKVHSVYIVVDLVAPNYKEVSFRDITYASCMANDQNCKTLASFTLESGKDDCDGLPGLVLCRLVRNSSKRWELEAVGSFVPGPSWKEAVPTVQKLHYPKKANPQKAAALEAPEEPKHSKRKSRVEFRGGLPPAAHEGAVMAPIPDVAEGCEEGENQVMQTFSMNANDSDPSVMMSFSMEGGEECARRAGRKAKKEANDPAKSQQQAAFSGEFDGIVELAPEAGEAEAEPSSWQDGPLCQFFCATQKTEPSA